MELEITEKEQGVIYDSIQFSNPDAKWCSFFCALYHSNDFQLKSLWSEYTSQMGRYVISKEISDGTHTETAGEHYHFCAEMTPQLYHTICKRIFKDTFNLRGQARGGPKQYGKVTQIRDITRMIAYCLKDGDFVTNIPYDEIIQYKKVSFKKIKPKDSFGKSKSFTEKIVDSLEQKYKDQTWDFDSYDDQEIILDHILDRLGDIAKVFDRNTLHKMFNGVVNALCMTSTKRHEYSKRWKLEIIHNQYMGN